jgi:hypothetical protein
MAVENWRGKKRRQLVVIVIFVWGNIQQDIPGLAFNLVVTFGMLNWASLSKKI